MGIGRGSASSSETPPESVPDSNWFERVWIPFRDRVVEGLFLILPLLITCWVIRWLYLFIEYYVVSPLSAFVVWKYKGYYPDADSQHWFEAYGAPAVGIVVLVMLLYAITFLAHTRLHRAVNWALIHLPVFCWIYNPVRRVFQTLETQTGGGHGHKRPQRMVLVYFPHTGIKVPGVVTASTRDVKTGKTILCVYVPTTPVPTSGYFLLVPEDQTTELNWTTEQTLQSIISGGLAAPPDITYFGPNAPGADPTTQVSAPPASTANSSRNASE